VDYTQATYLLRARKAARYVSLYGLSRTLAKIRAQYHMKSDEEFAGTRWVNDGCRGAGAAERCVALIGCGNHAYSGIAYYLNRHNPRFLRIAYDRHKSRAMSLCKAYRGAAAVADWREILTDNQVRIVFIASNHASHAEYAHACIEAGKHVYIEKPHVVTQEQLDRLTAAMRRHPQVKVFLGFNRPKSALFGQLQTVLASQAGPIMINCCVVGHELSAGHWYYNPGEGGQLLGVLCHWTDLTLHLVSLEKAFPCQIIPATPAGARSDFVVAVIFADRSCAAITFSAKGHTFEGVREMVNVQRGDAVARIIDCQTLTVDLVNHKSTTQLRHRDHGQGANILSSFERAISDDASGEDIRYIMATAKLFLVVRDAIEQHRPMSVSWDDILPGAGDAGTGSDASAAPIAK
jgi:predicted dehydrogenase